MRIKRIKRINWKKIKEKKESTLNRRQILKRKVRGKWFKIERKNT